MNPYATRRMNPYATRDFHRSPTKEELAEAEAKYWSDADQRAEERPLPSSAEDWVELKRILTTYFGVPDRPEFWATIAGHVMSVPPGKLTASYQWLANTGLKLNVNAAAQTVRNAAAKELEAVLAAKVKEFTDSEAAKEAAKVGTDGPSDVDTKANQAHAQTNPEGPQTNPDVQG